MTKKKTPATKDSTTVEPTLDEFLLVMGKDDVAAEKLMCERPESECASAGAPHFAHPLAGWV